MSGTPERTAGQVTSDLVAIACAGIHGGGDLKARTADRVRELTDEGYRLVREDERRKARRSLGQAWGAWLHLMMTVQLPGGDGRTLLEDAFAFEPGLREQFLAFVHQDGRSAGVNGG